MTDITGFWVAQSYASSPNASVLRISKPLLSHPSRRFASHPGGPKLRDPRKPYTNTGFRAPPTANTVSAYSTLQRRVFDSSVKMPENFCYSPRDLTEEMDQGQCGSCWAFSVAHMLADRVSIKSGGRIHTALSPRHIMECSDYIEGAANTGCQGNDPYAALSSVQSKPINVRARDDYSPYDAKDVQPTSCSPVSPTEGYSVSCSEAFAINQPIDSVGGEAHKANVENMKQHIYNEGPIFGTFLCPREFSTGYDGLTIYQPGPETDMSDSGYHAVEIVGWGKDPESGASYWVCRNSWGDNWPKYHKKGAGHGFFYIKMGENVLEIEKYAGGATPVVHNPDKAPRGGTASYFDDADDGSSSVTWRKIIGRQTLYRIRGKYPVTAMGLVMTAVIVVGGAYAAYKIIPASKLGGGRVQMIK